MKKIGGCVRRKKGGFVFIYSVGTTGCPSLNLKKKLTFYFIARNSLINFELLNVKSFGLSFV
jgi:hypothetical protein